CSRILQPTRDGENTFEKESTFFSSMSFCFYEFLNSNILHRNTQRIIVYYAP
ncbi:hypothetical protein COCVIDRAFT_92633, partial [Bipolaris victoriae FI3]